MNAAKLQDDDKKLPISYHRNVAEARLIVGAGVLLVGIAAFVPYTHEDKRNELLTRFSVAAMGIIGGGIFAHDRLQKARSIRNEFEYQGPGL